MKKLVNENKEVEAAVKAFMELGRERNKLVHQNFVNFSLDKNTLEVYDLYKIARRFIFFIGENLRIDAPAE